MEAVEVAELPVGVVAAAGSMADAAGVHPEVDMAEAAVEACAAACAGKREERVGG